MFDFKGPYQLFLHVLASPLNIITVLLIIYKCMLYISRWIFPTIRHSHCFPLISIWHEKAEDYKFENENKSVDMELERSGISIARSSSLFEATLATTSTTHSKNSQTELFLNCPLQVRQCDRSAMLNQSALSSQWTSSLHSFLSVTWSFQNKALQRPIKETTCKHGFESEVFFCDVKQAPIKVKIGGENI